MRVLSQNEKLWHTPLTLTLQLQHHKVTIPIDKRCLRACKHKLEEGHSAELFNNSHISVLYTKLLTGKNAAVTVHFHDQEVGSLLVRGRGFDETHTYDGINHVFGLPKLADAIVSRHATVPSCVFQGDITTPLPPYKKLKFCKDVLRAMNLSLPKPGSEHESRVFQGLQREQLIAVCSDTQPSSCFQFTGLSGAHMMLKFNNNFISRMVSCHPFSSLYAARSACLNVAAAQKFVTPDQTALLASTLEVTPLHTDTMQLLQNITEEPCTRVSYLDSTGGKQKIPVYLLHQAHILSLATSGLAVTANLPCYVAFTENKTPILLGSVQVATPPAVSVTQAAKFLQHHGELLTRRWLYAACTHHPELQSALTVLAKASAPKQGGVYAYSPVPALDLWATHEINLNT